MPKCPDCGTTCGIFERGFICPTCMRLFNFIEGRAMEGFDVYVVADAIRLYKELHGAGLLQKGANRVEFLEDGLLIERLGEDF